MTVPTRDSVDRARALILFGGLVVALVVGAGIGLGIDRLLSGR